MSSKEYVWNMLVLNCSAAEEKVLPYSLKALGFSVDMVFSESIEHFKQELTNRKWDMIIGVDSATATTPLKEALSEQAELNANDQVPFVILADTISASIRIDWMRHGACDVVDSGNVELLSLIMEREFINVFDEPQGSIEQISQSPFEEQVEHYLSDPDEKEKMCLFAIQFRDWKKYHTAFSDHQSSVFASAIQKELYGLFGHIKYTISADGIAMFLASPPSVVNAAQNLESAFDKLFVDIDSQSFQITISVAILELSYFDEGGDQLFNKVNDLLVYAQDKGVNKCEIYHPETEIQRQAAEGDAVAMVKHALENKNFELLFQPVASLQDMKSEQIYEVFVQLIDPEGKRVSAGQFIRNIDKTHLAEKVDRWVILQSVKHLLKKSNEARESNSGEDSGSMIRLFVHICAASIRDNKFLTWLFLLIKKTGINPASIVLLLGEENIARYGKETGELLANVKKIGCLTGISQFGSTVNPMRIAEEFATDYVKFDGKFTMGLEENSVREESVKTMVDKLHSLGRKTIIPQIENPRVLTRVWHTGSDYVQGYFLQKPEAHMNYNFKSDQ